MAAPLKKLRCRKRINIAANRFSASINVLKKKKKEKTKTKKKENKTKNWKIKIYSPCFQTSYTGKFMET